MWSANLIVKIILLCSNFVLRLRNNPLCNELFQVGVIGAHRIRADIQFILELENHDFKQHE